MTVTHENPTRTALADTVTTREGTGAGANSVLAMREGSTDIVVFDLNDPTCGSAVNGTRTFSGTPKTQAAVASGVVDGFQVRDKNAATVWSGSVTGSGGGGDIEITNANIAAAQDVQLASLTYASAT